MQVGIYISVTAIDTDDSAFELLLFGCHESSSARSLLHNHCSAELSEHGFWVWYNISFNDFEDDSQANFLMYACL
jgi:hypothetical protein